MLQGIKLTSNNMEGGMGEEVTKAILDRSEAPDVTVTCGPLTLSLHSFVLATHSKFFATMLDAPMVEKESRKVAVKNMEPEIFRKVLGFMYTKKLSLDVVSQLEEMLEAADRFDMEELKERIHWEVWWWRIRMLGHRCRNCEPGCKEKSDFRDNLVTTAILAERYNAEKLLNSSVEQMVRYNIRPEMEELTNSPKLEVAVIDEHIVKYQEVSEVKDRRRELKDEESELAAEVRWCERCESPERRRTLALIGREREELDNREKVAAKMMEEVVLMALEAWRYSVPDF